MPQCARDTRCKAVPKVVPMTRNEAHPITVEVVRNAIVAYADEMANALSKAAYNMMIYEVRDYCCGLIDTQARMICHSVSLRLPAS